MNKNLTRCFTLLVTIFISLMTSFAYTQSEDVVEDSSSTEHQKLYKLAWAPSKFAESYLIEISRKPDFRDENNDISKIVTEMNFYELLLPIGTYYVRVAGLNTEGGRGEFSEVIKIIVEFRVDINESFLTDMYNIPQTETYIDGLEYGTDTNNYSVSTKSNKMGSEPDKVNLKDLIDNKIGTPALSGYSDEVLDNLYYYLALCHLHEENMYMAIYYFEMVYAISEDYTPEFISDTQTITLDNGMSVKVSSPENFVRHKSILDYIDYNIKMGLECEKNFDYKKALHYYQNVIDVDPYNKEILKRISRFK